MYKDKTFKLYSLLCIEKSVQTKIFNKKNDYK